MKPKKSREEFIFANDTIDVVFNIPVKLFSGEANFEKLQYKLKDFDLTGKIITLRPDKVKDMAQYFSDCPSLVARIESKDFRKNAFEVYC